MRFICDSCGKRFASVDEPFPGRVYKIRCRRCGHLISVQAPVPWEEPTADLVLDVQVVVDDASQSRGAVRSALRREALVAGLPEPRSPAPAADGTEEVPIDLALSDEFPLIRKRHLRRNTIAASIVTGAAALGVVAVLLARGTGRAPAPAVAEGPAASPPAGSARAAALPPPSAEPTAPAAPLAPPALSPAAPPAPLPVSAVAPPTALPARPAARPPAAAAPPRPSARTPVKPAALPVPAATPQERPRPPRGTVAFESETEPGAAAAPTPAAVDPELASALLAKDDVAVRAVPVDMAELRAILDGRRAVLAACFDGAAGTGGAAAWEGRTPQLVVRVEPSGAATGRVDDPVLEPTPIASCLRRTVARVAFPAFGGEPVELKVPVGLPER